MSGPAVDEWARALRCLASAEILLQSGDPDSSVSRSYYAAFHAAVAYFLVEGREFGKHEAVESAFLDDRAETDAGRLRSFDLG